MDKYNLEYSEIQGFFHYAVNDNNKEYKLICKNLSYKQCYEFTNLMFDKYPNINTGYGNIPTYNQIIKEFEEFLLT